MRTQAMKAGIIWLMLIIAFAIYNLAHGWEDMWFKGIALILFLSSLLLREYATGSVILPAIIFFDCTLVNLVDEMVGNPTTLEPYEYGIIAVLIVFETFKHFRFFDFMFKNNK